MDKEQVTEICKFDVERDITPEDKEDFEGVVTFLHKRAKSTGENIDWEVYSMNAMFYKTLYPNEELQVDSKTYKAIDAVGDEHIQRGNFSRYLSTTANKKMLFPDEWYWSQKGKDLHEDELMWKYFVENLEYLSPKEDWEYLYPFFEYAQNLKIISPKRFETLDLQKILGKDVWIEDIEDVLKKTHCYTDFTLLAAPMHILEYPGKIVLDELEWAEMEEEAQSIKESEDIPFFLEFSSKRKILSSKKVEVTDKNLNLIF